MEMRNWFPEDFSQQFSPQFSQPADPNRHSSSSSRSISMDSPDHPQALLYNLSTTFSTPHQQATQQALSQILSINFPSLDAEQAAMTRAILAVLSSSSPSSSSSSHQPPQPNSSAFRNYTPPLIPPTQMTANPGRQSMLKRSMAYFKNLDMKKRQELLQGSHPTVSQLHHMISERKRREKLNESFHALRTLLPLGSKV